VSGVVTTAIGLSWFFLVRHLPPVAEDPDLLPAA
jgi:hypothetical protein